MRALVTGGAGFIGSHIVEELLREGASVRVLDNFSTGQTRKPGCYPWRSGNPAGRPAGSTGASKPPRRTWIWIFHLAAFVSVPLSMQDPETCFAVNVAGTVSLLEAARQAGVRKVVLSSSTAVYGNTRCIPNRRGNTTSAVITVCFVQTGERTVRSSLYTDFQPAGDRPCVILMSMVHASALIPIMRRPSPFLHGGW